jgi:hypothetical protein
MAIRFESPIELTLSLTSTWEEIDLTSYGVDADAVLGILQIENRSSSTASLYGVRGKGSTNAGTGRTFQNSHSVYFTAIPSGGANNNKIEVWRNNTNIKVYIMVYLLSTEAASFLDNIDYGNGIKDTWTTLDLSGDVPVGTVIAFFNMDLAGGGNNSELWVRHKGSTDTYMVDTLSSDFKHGYLVGVDSNRECELRRGDGVNKVANLVGYTTIGVAKVNGFDVSLGITGSYQGIDLTAEVDRPDNTVVALIQISNDGSVRKANIRKNGETDDIYQDIIRAAGVWTTPLDVNNVFEGKIESTQVDFYVQGYLVALAAAFSRSKQARPLALKEGFSRTGSQAARQFSTKGAFN